MSNTTRNNYFKMVVLTILLGAFAGIVIWCFLKAVAVSTSFVWEFLPERAGNRFLLVILCAAGGLATGILHHFFGNYPDELDVVMGKIKKEKHYDYHPMFIMLVCAFLPLVFGSSVGPEAGLAGIIAALCYWVGDNVTFAKNHSALYSGIGEAVALGQLFRAPLFGILAVEEIPEESPTAMEPMPKTWKLVLYGLSTAASFGVIQVLNHFFGVAMGSFPSFSEVTISPKDYALILLYLPAGLLMYLFYEKSEHILGKVSAIVPGILRETLCGAVIGLTGILLPFVLFSGEEQMAELMETYGSYAPLFLIAAAILKLLMTAFCLKFGMKGGHFFPLIFACTCMGFGIAMLLFAEPSAHIVFAAGIVTAATLGAQLKKPLAVSVLMLLCFPVRFLFWIFLSAAVGGALAKAIEGRNAA